MKTYKKLVLDMSEFIDNFSEEDIETLYSLSVNFLDVAPNPHGEEITIPWSCSIETDGENLTLNGNAGPSSYGSCLVSVPLKDAASSFIISISVKDDESEKTIRNLLAVYGIRVVEPSCVG